MAYGRGYGRNLYCLFRFRGLRRRFIVRELRKRTLGEIMLLTAELATAQPGGMQRRTCEVSGKYSCPRAIAVNEMLDGCRSYGNDMHNGRQEDPQSYLQNHYYSERRSVRVLVRTFIYLKRKTAGNDRQTDRRAE